VEFGGWRWSQAAQKEKADQIKQGEQNDEWNSGSSGTLDSCGVIPDASDHPPRQTQSISQLAAPEMTVMPT
jgi:hypothetical protein